MSKRSLGILDKLIVKIIKVFLLLLVTVAVIIGAYFGYLEYEKSQMLKAESQKLKAESQKLKAELSYQTDLEWSWHDEYKRIQIAHIVGRNILRKVYMDRGYIIHAYKELDYSLSAVVFFVVSCEPSSEIITSQKFGSGKPKILKCNTDGDTLFHFSTWSVKGNNIIWEDNLDGFSFRVDFSDWDFTKLDQEITLKKAMSKIPAEQTNR
jgi:hypothetical protein